MTSVDTLLAALAHHPFGKRQYKVLLAVLSLSLGGTLPGALPGTALATVEVSSSELSRLTGITPAHCRETVLELEQLGVLRSRPEPRGKLLAIDLEPWGVSQRDTRPETGHPPSPNRDASCPRCGATPHARADARQYRSTPVPGAPTPHARADARGGISPGSQEVLPGSGQRQEIPPPRGPDSRVVRPPVPLRGGGRPDLAFHRSLSDGERRQATQFLAPVGADAQALLDVLAAAIQAGQVRKSPLAMLAALVRRWQEGTFDPTPGLRVAEARRRAQALETMERQREPGARQGLHAVAPRRLTPEEVRAWVAEMHRAIARGSRTAAPEQAAAAKAGLG